MTTINISAKAYKKVLKKKRELEERWQSIVSTADALDALLEGKRDV